MTNFEKWKEELTLEKASRALSKVIIMRCKDCPSYEYCDSLSMFETKMSSCSERFEAWGNLKARRLQK